jgi:hypothetical protein
MSWEKTALPECIAHFGKNIFKANASPNRVRVEIAHIMLSVQLTDFQEVLEDSCRVNRMIVILITHTMSLIFGGIIGIF